MLPARFRLSERKTISVLFREGQYAACREFALKWRPTHLRRTRVGFIAPKKHFLKAHDRNRAKRLLREAMRLELFQLRPGFDMIVVYRYAPKRLDIRDIRKTLCTLLERTNLLDKIHDGPIR